MGLRATRLEDLVSAFDWNGRCVFVTGATGLLGGWVIEALVTRGASVVALVRDEMPLSYAARSGALACSVAVHGDLTDLVLLERALVEYQPEFVFHLAAQTQVGVARRGPYHTFEANVRGTYALLEGVRRAGSRSRVLVASSDKAYGEQSLPYTEDMPLLAVHPYDASKAAAEIIARSYARSGGVATVVTRCSNLYGGGDLNWARLIPGTIRSLLRDEDPVIRSDGTPIRDYLHVRDAAEGCLAAATCADVDAVAYNLSSEKPLSVLEVVSAVARAVGKARPLDIRAEAEGEIPSQYASAARARAALGWSARTTLDEGLRETVEWYRDYFRATSGGHRKA